MYPARLMWVFPSASDQNHGIKEENCMNRFRVAVLVGLVTVLSITGMAFAQSGVQGKGGQQGTAPIMGGQLRFDSIDANHDGKISKEEFLAHAEEMFKSMDANGDGVLLKDELTCCKGTGKGCAGCPECPGGGCKGKGTGQRQGTTQ
jgi:hypothetical protein